MEQEKQYEQEIKLFYSVAEVKKKVYSDLISTSTLLNMVKRGDIPCVRLMKRVFIPAWWVQEQIDIATKKPEFNK